MPSGDHTGPLPPRESIESSGIGAYHFTSPPAAEIVWIWLVPSRKRTVIGAMPASAMRLPSGDHVGVPGCGNDSWMRVMRPLSRSRMDISATRHMPSTLKNTIRLPSGENDAPWGCVVMLVTLRLTPLFMSRTHSCRCGLSRSDEYTSDEPSGDHDGSVSSAASLVTLTGAPPLAGIT